MVHVVQHHIGEGVAVAALLVLLLVARLHRRRKPVPQSPVGAYRTYPVYDR